MKLTMMILLASAFAWGSVVAPPCVATPNVTTIAACSVGNITNSRFTVTFSGFSSAMIGLAGVEMVDGGEQLDFTVTTDPGVVLSPGPWIRLQYDVATPGKMMDGVSLSNWDSEGTWIYEGICTGEYDKGGSCIGGDKIGLVKAGPGMMDSISIPHESHLSLLKTIAFGDAWSKNFSNSVTEAPEPVSLSMMGLGLIGLGLVKFKKRKG